MWSTGGVVAFLAAIYGFLQNQVVLPTSLRLGLLLQHDWPHGRQHGRGTAVILTLCMQLVAVRHMVSCHQQAVSHGGSILILLVKMHSTIQISQYRRTAHRSCKFAGWLCCGNRRHYAIPEAMYVTAIVHAVHIGGLLRSRADHV